MKEIKLTQGKIALVDDADFERVSAIDWHARKEYKVDGSFYAGKSMKIDGKWRTVFLHRFILGNVPKGKLVDHIDGNGLNNQRSNLRICNMSENMCNRRVNKNSTSGLKGVSWSKRAGKWISRIRKNSEIINLGVFTDKFEAHQAYVAACNKYHGEYARTQ